MKPGIRFRERLGLAECPYLTRWVLHLGLFSIRLHHWLASDDQRYMHDHPWWFVTFVLSGSYEDASPRRTEVLEVGSVRFRGALHRHTVRVLRPAWTLLITGPEIRKWGFWVKGKFKKANKYFLSIGHHPCS